MSGAMINIGGDVRDMNYRYKMPALTVKVEGRGNGIKTVIPNMVDIARALHIHPAYPTKFFGIELGAQSKFNVETERAIVNGCHQAGDLQKLLTKFIDQFILCPTCKLPELKMSVKPAAIKIECAACGHASQIKSAHRLVGYVTKNPPKSFSAEATKEKKEKKKKGDKAGSGDELDEAGSSVVAAASSGGANADAAAEEADAAAAPKAEETEEERRIRKEAKKAKKEKKEAKKAKKAKKEAKEGKEKKSKDSKKEAKDKDSGESEESSDEEDDKTEAAAEDKPKKADKADKAAAAPDAAASSASASSSKAVSKAAALVAGDDDDEDDDASDPDDAGDDWHTDTSKAAQKSRQDAEFKEMLAGAKNDVESIMLSAKAENKSDSPVTILKIFLASKARTPQEISAELRRLAMSRGLDEPQKLKTLLESIIDIAQPKLVVEQFKAKAELLKYFTKQATAAAAASSPGGTENKNSATMLLTCIEDLIGVVERKLLPAASMILKTLYEEDVLEEATLIAWYDAPPEASWLVNKDVAAEVRTKARPFIEWLKTAEEEDDDE